MTDIRHFPPKEDVIKQLSLILMFILLSELFQFPERSFEYQFPGLYINFTLNKTLLVSLFVTGIICTGLISIMRKHPNSAGQNMVIHWFLPIIIAFSLLILLEQIPQGFFRYFYIILSGIFIAVVIIAEYITLDSRDTNFLVASIAIQGVANGAFVIVTAALQNLDIRLFYILPFVFLFNLAFSYRVLILQIEQQKALFPALIYSLIVAEVAASIHYFQIRPIQYGLLLVGVSYCLLLFINPIYTHPDRTISRYFEGFSAMLILWGIALFIL